MTYREIGKSVGLKGFRLEFYVSYMVQRWGDVEGEEYQTRYATEWAYRFVEGNEYCASDDFGRALIKNIYEEHWNTH